MKKTKILVPATTANLGSGFDVFGMALNLYNEITFIPQEKAGLYCRIEGEGADFLKTDGGNLFIRSMHCFADRYQKELPSGILEMKNNIPLSRGLGSSSAAIVGGVYLANLLTGNAYSKTELLPLVIDLEGHPDNVAPALLGNFIVSLKDGGKWRTISYEVPAEWSMIAVSPRTPISTEKARRVIPVRVAHRHAVENVSAAVALISALVYKCPELLSAGFTDNLHVPYRLPLIKNGEKVLQEAIRAGAYAATISGSGSTILAIGDNTNREKIAEAMRVAFGEEEEAKVNILSVCTKGVHEIDI